MALYELLHQLNIPYQEVSHAAVYTIEEAERLQIDLPGVEVKNLFIKDKTHYFLYCLPAQKRADLKALRRTIESGALTFAKEAFRLSEEYHTPILLRMCTRISHSQSIVEKGERQEVPKREYVKDPLRVMMTTNSMKAHHRVEERTAAMTELAETTFLNRMEMGEDTSIGIITSSTSYQYVREVFGDKACVLKLGLSWPMPVQKIQDFAAQVDKVLVVEELEPIIENHCRQIGVAVSGKDVLPMIDELTQGVVARCLGRPEKETVTLEDEIPGRPPVMCAGCPHRGLFYTLSKNKCTVLGDIGCYTLGFAPPLNCMDVCICMGGGFSAGMGMAKSFQREGVTDKVVFGVMGDSTFFHSGMTGAAEIIYNNGRMIPCVLDNRITGMTGHQDNPGSGYTLMGEEAPMISVEKVFEAYGYAPIFTVDPQDLTAMKKTVDDAVAALNEGKHPAIVTRRPCLLIKRVKHDTGMCVVNPDKCKSCKSCLKVGCPAISMENGKAFIDRTQCVGCTVCAQACPFDAIEKEEK